MQALNPARNRYFNRRLEDSNEHGESHHDDHIDMKANLGQTLGVGSLAPPSILTPEPSPVFIRHDPYGEDDDEISQLKRRSRHQDFNRANTVLETYETAQNSQLPEHFAEEAINLEQREEQAKPKIRHQYRFKTTEQSTLTWAYFLMAAVPVTLLFMYAVRTMPEYYREVYPEMAKHAPKDDPQFIPRGRKFSIQIEKPTLESDGSQPEAATIEPEVQAPRMSPKHLLYASESGDLAAIRAILGAHKSARLMLSDEQTWLSDPSNPAGDNPAHRAARFGRLDALKVLISEFGADIDKRNLHNDLPIHVAAFEGHWSVAEYIANSNPAALESRGYCNQTPLQRAAANGKLAMVQLLAKRGAKLDARSVCTDSVLSEQEQQQGDFAIHLAAQWGHVDVVSYFVEANRNLLLEARNHLGRTPLLEAAHAGHLSVVESLVNRGANLYARDYEHESTVVHLAAGLGAGFLNILDYLTNVKPDLVESRDANGMTPLLLAASVGNMRIVQHLITKKNANVHARTETDGELEVIHLAAKSGNANLVSFLLSHRPKFITCRAGNGDLPIHTAAISGQLAVVQLLLAAQKDLLEAEGYAGRTPLLAAIAAGELNAIRYLIEKAGANVFAQSSASGGDSGATILHLAARHGHRELIPYLLNSKPELINLKDANGDLPIHAAAVYDDNMRVLDLIVISRRADLESIGAGGRTPLIAAAVSNRPQVVEYLANKGANLHAWAPFGDKQMQAIHMAAQLGYADVVSALLRLKPELADSRLANQDAAIHLAAVAGQERVVDVFITDSPSSIEATGFIGRTPILAAATAGQVKIVDLLMKKGANVFARDNEYESTALHLAARFGHLEVVQHLLAYAPELLHAVNKIKDQPIHRAVFGGALDVIRYLVEEKKANIEARGELGRTPLLLACTRGSLEVVNYLISAGADILAKDYEHEVSAVHLASYFNHPHLVERLVDAQPALLNAKDSHGHSALDMAKQQNNADIVEILEKAHKNLARS